MYCQLVCFLLSIVLLVKGDIHDEFPQWDTINWVVPSADIMKLPCYHPTYYPFNDLNVVDNIQWILPKETSYRHLSENEKSEGWEVKSKEANYTLEIKKTQMNVAESVHGMYVCAALAKIPNEINVYAWHYLRWGVGIFDYVPAFKQGSVMEKYHWNFIYAFVALLVLVVLLVLLYISTTCRYKGGPIEDNDQEAKDDDESIDLTSVSLKKPPPATVIL